MEIEMGFTMYELAEVPLSRYNDFSPHAYVDGVMVPDPPVIDANGNVVPLGPDITPIVDSTGEPLIVLPGSGDIVIE
jgi:hypothetical protein